MTSRHLGTFRANEISVQPLFSNFDLNQTILKADFFSVPVKSLTDLIPEREPAVGADGGQSPVNGMKGDVVDGVDVLQKSFKNHVLVALTKGLAVVTDFANSGSGE